MPRLRRFVRSLHRSRTDLWDFRTYGYHPVWFARALWLHWLQSSTTFDLAAYLGGPLP